MMTAFCYVLVLSDRTKEGLNSVDHRGACGEPGGLREQTKWANVLRITCQLWLEGGATENNVLRCGKASQRVLLFVKRIGKSRNMRVSSMF
jgi:hypothetical protein